MTDIIEKKEFDTTKYRIQFVKDIVSDKLESLIEFDANDTEQFINPHKKSDDDSYDSGNTRYTLNKKDLDFHEIINNIGGKLKYIKSGSTGHTFKGTYVKDGTKFNYAVKVVAYPKKNKYGSLHSTDRPENVELSMIRLLSYFVVNRRTPHVILPITTFNTNIRPFTELIHDKYVNNSKKYQEFVDKYNNNEYHDSVSILISEWANCGDFLDYIRQNGKTFTSLDWKVFFFQIISTLAVIQSKYPSFKHNDLKANNILIHEIAKQRKYFGYTVLKQRYHVPNIGFRLKLWDFDFASIKDVIENIKVNSKWATCYNISNETNRYYDIHYFFNTLIKNGFYPEFMSSQNKAEDAKAFVNRIVPRKYQRGDLVHKKGRILVNDEYLTPADILKDKYFDEFRKNNNTRENNIRKKKSYNSDNFDPQLYNILGE